ncbi:MAG: acyl-CoA thioesterase [Acidobacteriota bacterium]|nr:acyl-CoA thioesterase [Acidobacteriota bacterium]
MPEHISKIRVRYAETDQMGVAYHANYLIWMEVARVDLCRELGFDYSEMERDGILLAVTESHCRYISPARYDEEISIETSAGDISRRFITFNYELRCGDRRVATGQTKHIYLGREFRPTRLPDKYARLFGIA